MTRPKLPSRLTNLTRIKSSSSVNGGVSSSSATSNPTNIPRSNISSPDASRNNSPRRGNFSRTPTMTADNKALSLVIKVVKGRDLAPKDKSGTSDPYLVLRLGDTRQSTSTINKSLNPEWNQTVEMPIAGEHSALLEVCCWDKDRFGKDYMGEFHVVIDDVFQNGQVKQEPRWYQLDSKRNGKKSSVVSGAIQLQFTIYDPSNPAANPQELIQRLHTLCGVSTPHEGSEDPLSKADSQEPYDDDDLDDLPADEADDIDGAVTDPVEKKKRRRLAGLKKKVKQRAYEFSGESDVAGVLFIEIQKVTDLPPERNMTRTGWDMDPFVVISLGRKTYRTKVIRHDRNPIYDEKLVFQVLQHEVNYSVNLAVVDRDKLSGNDYVGQVNFPLEEAVSSAPTADPKTGLYDLPDIPEPGVAPAPTAKKSRFRLPLSRSSSATNIPKANRLASFKRENSGESLAPPQDATTPAPAPTSNPMEAPTSIPSDLTINSYDSVQDPSLRSFELPLAMKNKDRWEDKHKPTIFIKAKYLPYQALRQQFWRAMLKQYDADESNRIDKVELTTMLDTLGSTLKESTINSFFTRFNQADPEVPSLSFDQAVICLEDQLQKTQKKRPGLSAAYSSLSLYTQDDSGIESGTQTPMPVPSNYDSLSTSVPAQNVPSMGKHGEEGAHLGDDLSDDRGEEHVIEIRECPICHQPRLNKRTDADIITHVATCASQDWRAVNNIMMAGFVTSSQAQRKWYSKVITKVSYGGYKLGANSANILVQDRITGQINEERMSVYVRLGIRLLYKGLKANRMEGSRIKKTLRNLSIKQGAKYDDPASAKEISGFIQFHQLDMSEVLHPQESFRNFNEFFYRELKPTARPCSAPDRPQIITSPADCRTVVFNQLQEAQRIWVKGRDFTVEKLLGDAYPEDAKRYQGGSLGIFRLAPQDYHRFHVPVDGVLDEPKAIEGEYYTVNPMAIRSALDVYGENVRVICPIDSVAHGRVMFICIGAMMVGSTVITRKAGEHVKRAEELGYFKFGGSTVLLLFEPGKMVWDEDIHDNAAGALETLVRVGMSVGHSPDHPPHTPDMKKANPTSQEMQEAKRRIEGSLAPDVGDQSGSPANTGTGGHHGSGVGKLVANLHLPGHGGNSNSSQQAE